MASDRLADAMRAGFDRRYRAAAVHTVAAQEGLGAAQAERLLDSAEFGERLDRLDVGSASFTSQVRDLVRSAAGLDI